MTILEHYKKHWLAGVLGLLGALPGLQVNNLEPCPTHLISPSLTHPKSKTAGTSSLASESDISYYILVITAKN